MTKTRYAHFLSFILGLSIFASTPYANQVQEFEGIIEPFELVNVGTPVAGVVSDVNVDRSSTVEKGQPLVLLESSVERAEVERAQLIAAAEGDLKLQKEQLLFAERIYKRIHKLYSSEAISAEKYDQASTEVVLASARLQKAEENKSLARIDLTRAKAMLDRRTITSPLSGIVTARYVSPGEYVSGQPLIQVAQMDPLRVEVILPANMFRSITPGMSALISPETDTDKEYTSKVTLVDRIIDPGSATFGVRLELPNPDYRLPSGLKCTVRFVTTEPGEENFLPENN